ncbi:hypothetical protein Tco_1445891 [Tanacetum coccineum]
MRQRHWLELLSYYDCEICYHPGKANVVADALYTIFFDPNSLIEKLLNDDPSSPLPPKELNFEELKTIKSSIDDPPKLELKDLPAHLEYAFLERTDKLPVIISKELKDE